VQKVNISFELLCINAINIASHVKDRRFDRIEVCAYLQSLRYGADGPRSLTSVIVAILVHMCRWKSSLRS
jgi:hypothetical protein